MDVAGYNRDAWDAQVDKRNRWTVPVGKEVIAAARRGEFTIQLTPQKAVPADWFPPLADCRTLCLASGGGQQAPILSAAGATVTVLDNSRRQLEQDQAVAARDGLQLTTVQGDMRDLSAFDDASFDFVFHPSSLDFVPDVGPVFREAFRVMRPGGTMLTGMCNPVMFIFDYESYRNGEFIVRHSIPYSDTSSISDAERRELFDDDEPLCFGHSLGSLIGGIVDSGFHVNGFYEDYWGDHADNLLDRILPVFFATRAMKPRP